MHTDSRVIYRLLFSFSKFLDNVLRYRTKTKHIDQLRRCILLCEKEEKWFGEGLGPYM